MNLVLIGRWAFLIGLALSVIAGFGGNIPSIAGILFALGLIVGFLNVTDRESSHFLIAITALIVIGIAGLQFGQATHIISGILHYLISFASAAGIVVAVKQVLGIAKTA